MIRPPDGRGGPQVIPRPDGASIGGGPPWGHIRPSNRSVDFDTLVSRVRRHRARFDDRGMPDTSRQSAVLVALWEHLGESMVLLTRRSPAMRSHRHEVSFPGGQHDETDADLRATALREAYEEVALDPSAVTIIGQLDRFVTGGSGSLVHPFVAILDGPPQRLAPNPAEVEEILQVPLNELLLDEVWREEQWSRDGSEPFPVTFFELRGDTVWGATANMLRQLLTIATDPGT